VDGDARVRAITIAPYDREGREHEPAPAIHVSTVASSKLTAIRMASDGPPAA
jgi:hypothetical protein